MESVVPWIEVKAITWCCYLFIAMLGGRHTRVLKTFAHGKHSLGRLQPREWARWSQEVTTGSILLQYLFSIKRCFLWHFFNFLSFWTSICLKGDKTRVNELDETIWKFWILKVIESVYISGLSLDSTLKHRQSRTHLGVSRHPGEGVDFCPCSSLWRRWFWSKPVAWIFTENKRRHLTVCNSQEISTKRFRCVRCVFVQVLTVYHAASSLGWRLKELKGIEYPVTHLEKA